ncbi:hypothetical protein GCM10011404_20650 [Sphingomonas prati]|nr:hypothetical protein GCM10011404_20650 [Sphingomonas prati]
MTPITSSAATSHNPAGNPRSTSIAACTQVPVVRRPRRFAVVMPPLHRPGAGSPGAVRLRLF